MNKEKDLEILQFFYNIETLRQNRKKYKDYFDNIDKYEDIHNYLINRFYPQCEDKSSIERIRAFYDPRITDEVKYNLEHTPKCPVCGEYIPFKFDRFPRYFNETCNQSCQAKLKYSREMESGNVNFGASKEAKDKIRRTKEENKCNFEFVFSGKQIKVEKYDKMLTDILVLETKDNKERVGERLNNIYHNKKYEKYKNIRYYLNNRFPDSDSPSETLLRIKYNVEERPVCPICGGKVKYNGMTGWTLENSLFDTYCSNRCANKANKEAANETKKILYGSSNNSSKRIETIISIHGENYFSELMKKIWENKSEEERLEVNEKISKSLKNRSPLEKAAATQRMKETKFKNHGDPNYTNPNKAKETNILKHGSWEAYVENQSVKIKNGWSKRTWDQIQESLEKGRQTKFKEHGDPDWSNFDKAEQTNLERYGVKCPLRQPWVIEKLHTPEIETKKQQTRDKNGTNGGSISLQEIDLYNLMLKYGFNVIHHYRDNRYSREDGYKFECDYYLPDYDIFIEFNGSQKHGGKEYTGSEEDKILLETNKYICVDTFITRDPYKYNIARKNKLKYIVLWDYRKSKKLIKTGKLKEFIENNIGKDICYISNPKLENILINK